MIIFVHSVSALVCLGLNGQSMAPIIVPIMFFMAYIVIFDNHTNTKVKFFVVVVLRLLVEGKQSHASYKSRFP